MADSSTITFEQDPPRRPSLDDLDGGQCENDAENPPVPGIDPDALAMNQRDKLVVGLAGMCAAAWLYITFPGGVATVSGIGGMRQGAEALVSADFTIVETATGSTTITHTGGKLPAMTWPAGGWIVGGADTTVTFIPVTNGVRVETRTGGALADVAFVVFLSGV